MNKCSKCDQPRVKGHALCAPCMARRQKQIEAEGVAVSDEYRGLLRPEVRARLEAKDRGDAMPDVDLRRGLGSEEEFEKRFIRGGLEMAICAGDLKELRQYRLAKAKEGI